MSEPADGSALLQAPPSSVRRSSNLLEAILVVVAFASGVGLTAFAMATEPKEAEFRAGPASPTAAPSPSAPSPSATGGTGPSPSPEPANEGPVLFASATSGFTPGSALGCEADVFWEWQPDPSNNPPFGATARIRVTGPGIAGIHEAKLTRRGLRLELHVSLSGDDRWSARPLSVGDRPITEFPLEVSSQYPFC
jgi:hypothetical protein